MLLNQIKVLDCDQYPADLPVGFQLNAAKIKNAYWDYLDNSHCIPKELNELMNCTKLIACSSAECERGFSLMNIIVSPTRNRLLIPRVSSLMFIKLHGPSLKDWNPEPYISTWLRSHHSEDNTRTRVAKERHHYAEQNVYAGLC
ncbi:hypothetical protein PR048_008418 [Dryococelus australis]|uniref:HAT C-terminal dimerisation domain-containing protein n=1 Tax=Dryococelus australis TaxID=614101 RepID=A0ABQ9HXV2_9NEOP|nr:hypothetical protein PR048_008418 [Dryococelus australis]